MKQRNFRITNAEITVTMGLQNVSTNASI